MDERRRSARWIEMGGAAVRREVSGWRRLSAPQLFVLSFTGLIALGTLGLRLLPGLYTGERLGWLDALFTATSAACLTGLIVVDTATYFTFTGQLFLLVLIQLGGLGMIGFTTLIILALGKRLSLRVEALSHGTAAEVAPDLDLTRLGRDIFTFTLAIEAAGAALLYMLWVTEFGWGGAVWPAVFHSVSAFCNAGFSVFSDSMMSARRSELLLLIMAALVVLGSLGFLTLEEFAQWRRALSVKRRFRMSLHSRIALVTTGTLLLFGWAAFATFEWHHALAGLTASEKLTNALFMSTMPRSGGFQAVDYGTATQSTSFLTIILMFIGGSPGSTAGGIKVTTFALIGLLALSRFRGREIVHGWGRSIPEETIQRAVGLAVVAFTLVTAGIFLLTWTEGAQPLGSGARAGFLAHMFEAASAFNSVGLSMNLTPRLSDPGRLLGVLMMFIGRVGPLTFAAALALRRHRRGDDYRYAYDEVVVG